MFWNLLFFQSLQTDGRIFCHLEQTISHYSLNTLKNRGLNTNSVVKYYLTTASEGKNGFIKVVTGPKESRDGSLIRANNLQIKCDL